MTFILSYSSFYNCNSTFSINKIWSTWSSTRFTKYTIPILLEVRLYQLESIESRHILRSTRFRLTIFSRWATGVMSWILVRHLIIAISCRFCTGSSACRTISWFWFSSTRVWYRIRIALGTFIKWVLNYFVILF